MSEVLPVEPSIPNQRVGITLEEINYVFDFRWNDRTERWYMDISEEDETAIRNGISVSLGAILGGRIRDDRFPLGALYAVDLTGEGIEAGLDDLGERVLIYYFTFEELEEIGA